MRETLVTQQMIVTYGRQHVPPPPTHRHQGHADQHTLYPSSGGRKPELCPSVVHQIELDVPAAAYELPVALGGREGGVLTPLDCQGLLYIVK